MRHAHLLALVSGLALALAGCGDDGSGSVCEACLDDGGADDAGSAEDAGADDAGAEDAGPLPDGGCGPLTACGLTNVVVDPAWLEDHLDTGLQVVDARTAPAHASERIPGALQVDASSLRATVDGVPGQVASAADVEAALSAAGVERTAPVVIYGERTTTTPARLFWTLEHYGHQGEVMFLDGGLARWTAEGLPTESGEVAPTPSTYSIDGVADGTGVDADWVLAALDDPSVVLVDARSDGEYASGHIPGAVSIDWSRNVDGDSFRALDDLRPIYEPFDPDATFVTYCQSGSRASVAYLALRWLGYGDVRLYDGSWAEWGSRSDLPKEPSP